MSSRIRFGEQAPDALTMSNGGLLEIQDALVRKLVGELHGFDNLYFELCNEPFAFLGVSPEWQAHVAQVLEEAQRGLGSSHLIAQELDISPSAGVSELRSPLAQEAVPQASILFIHNLPQPEFVERNHGVGKAVGFNETGFECKTKSASSRATRSFGCIRLATLKTSPCASFVPETK